MISKVANKPPCRDRRLIAMPPCHCLRRLCLALLDQSLVLLKKLYSHAVSPAKLNVGAAAPTFNLGIKTPNYPSTQEGDSSLCPAILCV